MLLKMKKNNIKDCELNYAIRKRGDWNFRDKEAIPLATKPLAIVNIDGDEFVWKHDDIFKLIKAYHEADIIAIDMIRKGLSGNVKTFETPFLDKLKILINELEQQGKPIQDGGFGNGQTALK